MRTPLLAREHEAARDDQDRPDRQPRLQRLAEQRDRQEGRERRGRADHDRHAGRPRIADRAREENRGQPRDEHADEEETPQVGRVRVAGRHAGRGRDHHRRRQPDQARRGGAEARVAVPVESGAHRDREQAEERCREDREAGGHARLGSSGNGRAHAHSEDHRRPPGRACRGGGARATRRPGSARGRDRDDGVPPVRAARSRSGRRADGLVRRPQRSPVRQQESGGPRVPAELCRALRPALLRPGNGIAHYLHLERFARPGRMLVGADSHTTMAGALGMLAIGAGATEVAVVMAGRPYVIERPLVAGVELRGALGPWVQSKDVVLELLRRHGVRGGRGRIFEFFGDGVAGLSATDRGTICNMIMETGATTGIFPSDARTGEWLAAQQRTGELRRAGRRRGRGVRRGGDDRAGRARAAGRAALLAGERRARRARRLGRRPGRCASAARSTHPSRISLPSPPCFAAARCTRTSTSRSRPGRGRSSTRSSGRASTRISSPPARACSSRRAAPASGWGRRPRREPCRCGPSTATSRGGAGRRATRSTCARRRRQRRLPSTARSPIRAGWASRRGSIRRRGTRRSTTGRSRTRPRTGAAWRS